MDSDSSLQLAKSFGDRESFKLLYLVYRCGLKDGNQIKNMISTRDNAAMIELIKKDVNNTTKLLANEVLI